jgi:hypothetical protein
MSNTLDKLFKVAVNEIGYLEKKTNSQLDSKTANAGSNNYTKYGKAMGCNGQPWCDAFVDWCFVQAYGKEEASKLLGGFSNYTPTSAQYYKNMKRWHTTPKAGDQIFFKNNTRICHTGIVYYVTSALVYTIEGNTSGGSGVIANGGGVCKKHYLLTNASIAGYGRPDYDNEPSFAVAKFTPTKGLTSDYNKIVKNLKLALNTDYGLKFDTSKATVDKTLMSNLANVVLAKDNDKPNTTYVLQQLLRWWGYVITIDGDFGSNTLNIVKTFQKQIGISETGTTTYEFWCAILGYSDD